MKTNAVQKPTPRPIPGGWRIGRRQLLRGAGSVSVGLPLLCAMLPNRSNAADPVRKRFFSMVTANGTVPDLWFPTGGETDFTLSPILTPFAPHRRDLLIFKGIDNKAAAASPGGGHGTGQASMLSGRATVGPAERNLSGGRTLDQEIATLWAGSPITRTPYRSLELGSSGDNGTYGAMSYSGPGMPMPKIGSAKSLFDRVFSNGSPEAERLRVRRASILDRVRGDYVRLQQKLGAEDKRRIESHVGSIREIEARLSAKTTCGAGALVPGTTGDHGRNLPQMYAEMIAVLIPALACDFTRVATYMFRTEGATNTYTFGWLGIGPDADPYGVDNRDDAVGTSHHTLSHHDTSAVNRDRLLKANRWYMEQIVMFIDKLKATPDGPGRSLFDGTTLLYTSAIGQGNHTLKNIPNLLIGSAGGRFKMGRYMTFSNASHNDLLTSVYQAMSGESTVFGDPAFGKGPLPGLT